MKLYLTAVFLIISINCYTQKLSIDQRNIISNDLAYYIKSDTGNFTYNLGRLMYVTMGDDTFYNPIGFHLLYQLKNQKATRIDKSSYHGHNFGRILYSHDNKIFMMGGYGFFTTNNNLEYFDLNLKEWNYIATKGDRPGFINGLIFKKDTLVYLINTYRNGNFAEPDQLDSYIYTYNINSNKWSKYKNYYRFNKLVFSKNYNLENYTISFSEDNTLIIDKKSLNFILLSNSEVPVSGKYSNFLEIQGDTIFYTHFGSLEYNENQINLNVDSLYHKHYSRIEKIDLDRNKVFNLSPKFVWLAILILIFIVIIIIAKVQKNKIKKTTEFINKDNYPLLSKLMTTKDEYITVDELDELLNIDHMEIESKKSKRHRIITQLNEEYPGIITREKDKDDKRRFLYLIDKKAIKKL